MITAEATLTRSEPTPVIRPAGPLGAPCRAYRGWVSHPIGTPPRVSVVIPADDEELRIPPTVGAIATHLSARGERWELIVADDGSTDTTVSLPHDLEVLHLGGSRGCDLVTIRWHDLRSRDATSGNTTAAPRSTDVEDRITR